MQNTTPVHCNINQNENNETEKSNYGLQKTNAIIGHLSFRSVLIQNEISIKSFKCLSGKIKRPYV